MSLMFVFVILVKDQLLPQASWEINEDLEFDNIFETVPYKIRLMKLIFPWDINICIEIVWNVWRVNCTV